MWSFCCGSIHCCPGVHDELRDTTYQNGTLLQHWPFVGCRSFRSYVGTNSFGRNGFFKLCVWLLLCLFCLGSHTICCYQFEHGFERCKEQHGASCCCLLLSFRRIWMVDMVVCCCWWSNELHGNGCTVSVPCVILLDSSSHSEHCPCNNSRCCWNMVARARRGQFLLQFRNKGMATLLFTWPVGYCCLDTNLCCSTALFNVTHSLHLNGTGLFHSCHNLFIWVDLFRQPSGRPYPSPT
mmetsp:Transcript_576/g.1780  ORF Transcript_576/g.1780 Transcript_576/m.1780 type:complete len:238 (+) Transcript_576:554-1267(+)